jgi:hypothetical protein
LIDPEALLGSLITGLEELSDASTLEDRSPDRPRREAAKGSPIPVNGLHDDWAEPSLWRLEDRLGEANSYVLAGVPRGRPVIACTPSADEVGDRFARWENLVAGATGLQAIDGGTGQDRTSTARWTSTSS